MAVGAAGKGRLNKERANKLDWLKFPVKVPCKRVFIIQAPCAADPAAPPASPSRAHTPTYVHVCKCVGVGTYGSYVRARITSFREKSIDLCEIAWARGKRAPSSEGRTRKSVQNETGEIRVDEDGELNSRETRESSRRRRKEEKE